MPRHNAADGLTPAELCADLLAIPLGARRDAVLRARTALQANGSLPLAVVSALRTLYVANATRIAELHAAREKARVSMAQQRLGKGSGEVQQEAEQRQQAAAKKRDDLGF